MAPGDPRSRAEGTPAANCHFLLVFQERPTEASASVAPSAAPSVAQLAGRFQEQAAAKEVSQVALQPPSRKGAGRRGRLGQAQEAR